MHRACEKLSQSTAYDESSPTALPNAPAEPPGPCRQREGGISGSSLGHSLSTRNSAAWSMAHATKHNAHLGIPRASCLERRRPPSASSTMRAAALGRRRIAYLGYLAEFYADTRNMTPLACNYLTWTRTWRVR